MGGGSLLKRLLFSTFKNRKCDFKTRWPFALISKLMTKKKFKKKKKKTTSQLVGDFTFPISFCDFFYLRFPFNDVNKPTGVWFRDRGAVAPPGGNAGPSRPWTCPSSAPLRTVCTTERVSVAWPDVLFSVEGLHPSPRRCSSEAVVDEQIYTQNRSRKKQKRPKNQKTQTGPFSPRRH